MIEIKHLKKSYAKDEVLENVNLRITKMGIYLIKGKSGCGKTTLLNILGLIDDEFEGEYILDNLKVKDTREKSILRDTYFSYLHQFPYFIESETVLTNLLLTKPRALKSEIHSVLKKVHLSNYEDRTVNTLSGGEKRRLSFASLLLKDTPVVLCDEITSALDKENKVIIMNLLNEMKKNHIIIFVTHENELIEEYSDVVIKIENKKITYIDEGTNNKIRRNKRKYKFLSFSYIFHHIIKVFKTKKIRMMMSLFTVVIALVSLGLSLSLKNMVSTSLKNSLENTYSKNQIIMKTKDEGYYIDEYLIPSKIEYQKIKKEYREDIISVSSFYIYNFEDNFYSSNELILNKKNSKVVFDGIGVREISEFYYIDDMGDFPIYPTVLDDLNEDEIILTLPLRKIYELCSAYRLEKSTEALSDYLEKNYIPLKFNICNESWEYDLTIDLKLKGFIVSTFGYHIVHSSLDWNEYILEDVMQLEYTNDFYKKEFKPWTMKKGYYFKVRDNNLDEIVSSFYNDSNLNGYDIHLVTGRMLNSYFKNDASRNKMIFLTYSHDNKVSISKLDEIYCTDYFNTYITCSPNTYTVYDEALLQGFVYPCTLGNSKDLVEEYCDKNEFSDQSLGAFQGSSLYYSKDLLYGDTINSSKKNSFKLRTYYDVVDLSYGDYPSKSNEIIASTRLLDEMNVDIKVKNTLYISFLTKIEEKDDGFKNIFKIVPLNIVGVVQNNEKLIYVPTHWIQTFFTINVYEDGETSIIDKAIFSIKENENVKEVINKMNSIYTDYTFYSPLMDMYDEVDKFINYINMFLLVFCAISLVSSIIMMATVSYLFYEENKNEIPTYIIRGYSKSSIVFYYFCFSLFIGIYGSLVSILSLYSVITFTSIIDKGSMISTLIINPSVYFIMFFLSIIISIVGAFISLINLIKNKTLTLLNK